MSSTAINLSLLSVANAADTASATPPSAETLNLFQSFILGMVQGLTEFLPISSTAHLKVVPVALGWGSPGITFTAVVQLGSIGAVLWYFWSDLSNLALGSIKALKQRDYDAQELRLTLGIMVGTIPIVVFGLLIKTFIPDFDNSPMRSLEAIASALIGLGLLLGLAEKLGPRKRHFEDLNFQDAVWMGLAQALALIPGVSRSGSTITAGLFQGLDRATAARFSFLLGIPAITLAGIVEFVDTISNGIAGDELLVLGIGTLSAAIFSYASIAWLLRYLQTQNTWVFVWYRVAVGVAIFAAVAGGVLQNS